jgi:tetratricopeptide (TPR) repeat protein
MGARPVPPAGTDPGSREASSRTPAQIPFTLSFADGGGHLGVRDLPSPPVHIDLLDLSITGLTFPFDLTAGPSRLRDRWLDTAALDLSLPFAEISGRLSGAEAVAEVGRHGLSELAVDRDRDALEVVGRVGPGREGPWFVARYVPDVVEEQTLLLRPALFVLLGAPVVAFPQVAAHLARLTLPGLSPRGLDLASAGIPRRVLGRLLPPAGFRIPDTRRLRLLSVALSRHAGVALSFRPGALAAMLPSARALAIGEVQRLLRPGDEAVAAGEIDGARASYLEALGHEPGHEVIVERLAWLDAVSATRGEAARVLCERVLAGRGDDAPGLRALLGSILIGGGARDDAARCFEPLLDHLGPLGQSRVLLLLGALRLGAGDPVAAAAHFESSQALDPSLVESLEGLRECYVTLGDRRQLQSVAARLAAVSDDPETRCRLFTDLGTLWQHRFGDVYRATDAYEQALLHQPDAPEPLLGLAECHGAKGEYQAALRCLDAAALGAAARDDRRLEVSAHLRAGALWEELGDRASAAARYHRAAQIDPTSAEAIELAADADLALGRLDLAAASLGRLVALASDRGDVERWRAALAKLTRLQLDHLAAPGPAVAALERFLRAQPGDPMASELLDEARRHDSAAALAPLLRAIAATSKAAPAAPPPAQDRTAPAAPRAEATTRPRGAENAVAAPEPPRVFQRAPTQDLSSAIARAAASANASPEPYRPPPPPRGDDLEALLDAHLANPRDEALADRVVEGLEAAEDWTRLVAVISGLVDDAAARPASPAATTRQARLLGHLAEVLVEGLGDRQSGAECLLRASAITPPAEGAAHARRAAALFRQDGLGDQALEADELADALADRGRG